MDDLKRLLAIEEIRQLKARYFRCMDTKDWDGLARVFAPNAVFDLREVGSTREPISGVWDPPFTSEADVYRGHAAVIKMIREATQHRITVHHGHMGEVEITGEATARGIWAMEDIVLDPPGSGLLHLHGYGHYHDTYAKLADEWAIETTRITRLYLPSK